MTNGMAGQMKVSCDAAKAKKRTSKKRSEPRTGPMLAAREVQDWLANRVEGECSCQQCQRKGIAEAIERGLKMSGAK